MDANDAQRAASKCAIGALASGRIEEVEAF
jgi:hypothetical protein